MKKIIYSILSLSLLFASCDDFLDTDSPSKQTPDNLYNSLFFTEASLMGIYSTLTESTVYGQKISTNWCTNSDIEFAGLTLDNYLSPTRDAGNSNYFSAANNTNQKWEQLYREVELATSAVEGIRNSELMQTADSVSMKAYLGEAITLRALGYFELVKHFGDIPFKVDPARADLSNVFIGKVDRDTIYKHLVDELLEAEQYLPWLGGKVGKVTYTQPDRITKGFVKGLIARISLFAGGWSLRDRNQFANMDIETYPDIPETNGYVTGRTKDWKRYYEIAARQCAEIIGSSENPHGLDDYENLWKTVNKLQYNTAKENLFEIAFGLGSSGDIGNLVGMRLDGNTKYGTIGLGGGNAVSSAYYFYSFGKEDKRKDVTLTNISYSSDNKEKMDGSPVNWKFAKWRIYWMTDEYLNLHKDAKSGRVNTGINWIVMRYSDILLMFAEAQNELYGSSAMNEVASMSAKDALEKVRERAFGTGSPEVSNYDPDFFEAVVNERAWEFGGEALRKYDLIRWGLLSKKIEDQKAAMSILYNGKGQVKIFDKTYQVENLPTKIYYKYDSDIVEKQEFIDRSSIDYYTARDAAPGDNYSNTSWLSESVRKSIGEHMAKLLVASTGLNATYNYSAIISQMDSASVIQREVNQYTMGNKICNNRHPFAIFYKDISDSQGAIRNSYGY